VGEGEGGQAVKDFHEFISESDAAKKWNPTGLQTFSARKVSSAEIIRTAEEKVARLRAQVRAAERKGDTRRATRLMPQVMDAEADLERLRSRAVSEAAKPTDLKASVAQAKKVVGDADKVMRTLRDRIKSSRAGELKDAGDDPSLHTQRLEDVLGEVEWEYGSLSRMLKQTPMPSWDGVEAAVGRLRKAVLAAKASLKPQG